MNRKSGQIRGWKNLRVMAGRLYFSQMLPLLANKVSAGKKAVEAGAFTAAPIRAKRALHIFLAYFATSFTAAIALLFSAVGYLEIANLFSALPSSASQNSLSQALASPAVILSMQVVGVAMGTFAIVLLTKHSTPDSLSKRALACLGGSNSTIYTLFLSAGVGLGLAILVLTVFLPLFPSLNPNQAPLSRAMANSGWVVQLVWVAMTVLLEPLVEEFLFRGILYEGIARSWGTLVSMIVVTVLFALAHLWGIHGYWPALIAVLTLGLLTMAARRLSGSLGPAVALHAAYNLGVLLAIYRVLPAHVFRGN